MAETYSAGVVTAYGAAVRGGYTGTYEEFCAEQAEFAENAAAVAQAKSDVETMQGQVEQAAATFTGTTVPAAVATVQAEGAAQVQAVQSEGTMQAAAVETVGAQQKAAVEAAGSDAVDAVETAETAATDAVTAAQTAAVQAVQAESTTQQAAIQTKGQETIDSIPEDYTALSGEVDDLKSAFEATLEDGTIDCDNIAADARSGHGITPANAWSWGEKQRSFICRIPDTVTSVTVKPKHDGTIVAFLASAPPPETPMLGSHPDFSTVYPTRIRLDIGGDTEYAIQETMNYLFVLVKNSSGNFVGPEITFTATSTTLQAVDTEVADETNVVDRRNEIYAMLSAFGKCELGKGVFYSYKNLCIPDGAVLCGSGKDTILKLLASVESGSAIKMGAYATVRDMTIKGADTAQNGNETEGSRNGVEWTGETQVYGTVDNCRLINFSGAGIYLHNTTQQTYRGLSIINCNVRGNFVGIDIRNDSEFNKIANCVITGNSIGYRNRGGNNNMTNCGIDANKTGILIDDNAGTNGGHGVVSGCSINHSNSNTGYGLIIEGTGRMLVENCNIYFSKLRLENTDGNVISGCGFGQAAGWEIEGGECSLFIGCMVRGWDSGNSPVTITNNTAVKIVNCFDRTGTPYA